MSICLVTGGAGFIGSHIVDSLIDKGHQVVIIDNLVTGNIKNLNPRATFYQQNVINPLNYIFDKFKFDYVFHLAAQINLRHSIKEPAEDALANVVGSLNILENCARANVKRVIFSSTGGAIYSPHEILPFTEQSLAYPESPYGLAKQTVEKYLEIFQKLYGLQYTVLRYSNVFGPRQDSKGEAGVIAIFIQRALADEDLTIFGDGKQTRDFVYVQDVVQANMLALEQELNGTFNVSSNLQYSVNDVAQKIVQYIPTSSKIVHTAPIVGELLYTQLSAEKLKARGWNNFWSLDNGIVETIKYFDDLI
jgi:UDP-glucose 4-epimerase